jgi:putative ABC transport system substrate-binding protein
MNRRAFIVALVGAAAWPVISRAQSERIWRVGYLGASGASTEKITFVLLETFRLELQQLGYVEGKNLRLDIRLARGDYARLPDLAAELVALAPDVIVSGSTVTTAVLKPATTSIPIVMTSSSDPVAAGFVKSLSNPGGNITGLSNQSLDFTAKSLELLHAAVPNARRIAVLRSPNPIHEAMIKEAEDAAAALDLAIIPVMARTPADLDESFITIHNENCDALFVLTDSRSVGMVELAEKWRLPAIYGLPDFVDSGGLLSYGPDYQELWRRAAIYVDRIIKGANPADLPVEQPTRLELQVNLKTAKKLGLTIPDSIVARADKVIE